MALVRKRKSFDEARSWVLTSIKRKYEIRVPPTERKKDQSLMTIALKKELVSEFENGTSLSELSTEYNIPEDIVYATLQNGATIKKMPVNVPEGVKYLASKNWVTISQTIQEMEKRLIVWIKEKQTAGEFVTSISIMKEAENVYRQLLREITGSCSTDDETDYFKANRNWFLGFLRRTGIHPSRYRTNQKQRPQKSLKVSSRPKDIHIDFNASALDLESTQWLATKLGHITQMTTTKSVNSQIDQLVSSAHNPPHGNKVGMMQSLLTNMLVTTSVNSSTEQILSSTKNHIHDNNVPQEQSENTQKEATTSRNSQLEQLKQKRTMFVLNHQQSAMSHFSKLWKAGRLCDAFISNGTLKLKVHKVILCAVCPDLLDVFNDNSEDKMPKVTLPRSVSKKTLMAFADYMYNGVLDLDPEVLSQMKIIAQHLNMEAFGQLCSEQLKPSSLPNMLPMVEEFTLSEPSSSGLIEKSAPQKNPTPVMKMIPVASRAPQKDVCSVDSMNVIPVVGEDVRLSKITGLPLVDVGIQAVSQQRGVRTQTVCKQKQVGIQTVTQQKKVGTQTVSQQVEVWTQTNSEQMEVMIDKVKIEIPDPQEDNNQYNTETRSSGICYSILATDNTFDINTDCQPQLKIENIVHLSPDQYHEGMLSSASSGIDYSTRKSTAKRNYPHLIAALGKTPLSAASASTQTSCSSHKSTKNSGNIVKNIDPSSPYPISLYTADGANVPLNTQGIKKEFNVG